MDGVALGLSIAHPDADGYFAKPWTRGSVENLGQTRAKGLGMQRSVVFGDPREMNDGDYVMNKGEDNFEAIR